MTMDFETEELIRDFRKNYEKFIVGDKFKQHYLDDGMTILEPLEGKNLMVSAILLKRINDHFSKLEEKENN